MHNSGASRRGIAKAYPKSAVCSNPWFGPELEFPPAYLAPSILESDDAPSGGATCALMGELDQHDLIGDAAPGSIRSGLMSAVALPGTFWTNAVLHLRRASELAASAGSRNE